MHRPPRQQKDPLVVAAVQFEMSQGDKPRNLAVMAAFIARAAAQGADVVAFPEICLTGYHFLTGLDRDALLELAERTDDGPSVRAISAEARRHGVIVCFGLVERDGADRLYNTYAVVGGDGLIFQHRKVHAFENSAVLSGDRLDVFELHGWTCGALICYDNNLPENGRVLALQGAQVVFAPHQTGGFDIPRAGMGRIPAELWRDRDRDPQAMRDAIRGPKGREWLLKWLPARAYDNSCYLIFANGVGIDGPEVRPGCSMIIDPDGRIMTEICEPADGMVIAALRPEACRDTLGSAHIASRRPSLYGPICEPIEELDTRVVRNRLSIEKIR